MTTEPSEPKAPIRIDVVQKQFKNGMKLPQLARLYEVDEETLKPIVADIVPKERKEVKGQINSTTFMKEELIEILERHPTASAFKGQIGLDSTRQMNELLEIHGLSHMLKTSKQVQEERYNEIIKLLEKGMSQKEIARRLNTSAYTISTALKYFGRDDLMQIQSKITQKEKDALAEKMRAIIKLKTKQEILAELQIKPHIYELIRKEYQLGNAKPPIRTRNNNTLIRPKNKEAAKVKKASTGGRPKIDRKEMSERIARLHELGMSVKMIAQQMGISEATYYNIKKELGADWKIKEPKKKEKAPHLVIPEPKEEPPVKETTTANLESAVTAFKAEEVSELIGTVQKHIEHKKPSTRIINRDKDVWGEYLSARSQEIHDVAHDVEVLVEDGKLIERTVIAYTLERELGR